MPTQQMHRRQRNERLVASRAPAHDRVTGHHHARSERLPQRIGHATRLAVSCQSQDIRVIGVDDERVRRPLVHKEPGLGRRVRLDVGMAVEMVRVQVQEDRDPWPERRGQLELEARHLDHVDRFRHGLLDLGAQRRAHIAAHQDHTPTCLEHPPEEHGRRRLALGTRDRDEPTAYPA